MSGKRVIIIGAGLGSLSAAARLASKGFDVHVYEKNESPGGKAGEIYDKGFRWDTGPSLLTLPSVLGQFFEELDMELEDRLEIIKLDPITKYFYPDGTMIEAFADRERFASEIEENTGEKAERVLKYLDHCKRIYELTSGMFMYSSLNELSTYLKIEPLRTLARIRDIDALRTMHVANSRWFKDKRVIQLFDRYATYNGSSPYMAPATFNLIQHVEFGMGGYAVKGGIHEISKEMLKAGTELGVKFHFEAEVESIEIASKKVKGVKIDGKVERSDIVISDSDVAHTYGVLLGGRETRTSKRLSRLEASSSGGVFYWGLKSTNKELLVHNILFSENYEREFKDIWTNKRAPRDPTVYINITSKIDPEDGANGGENWFTLINVPYDDGQDWKKEMADLRGRTLSRIETTLGRSIGEDIVSEQMIGPEEIREKWITNRGSIYGISSNDRSSAFRRQGNRSREYKGLYFSGGSAHPGGGMPLVILSGRITSDLVQKYET